MLMLLSLTSAFSYAQGLQIPADLIRQLFNQNDPNQHIKKRPFNFAELEHLLSDPRFSDPKTATELVRRYLNISYVAGTVSVMQVAKSKLPDSAKKMLFSAPAGSVRFADLDDVPKLITTLSPDLFKALFAAKSAVLKIDDIDVAGLLLLNNQRYNKDIYYGTYMYIQDAHQNEYLFSTPRAKNHLLAGFLDNTKDRQLDYFFTAAHCTQQTCTSQKKGNSFASFKFQDSGAFYVNPANYVRAKCSYEGTYRREYTNRTQIEFAFEKCKIVSINGKPPQHDSLLDDLIKVK